MYKRASFAAQIGVPIIMHEGDYFKETQQMCYYWLYKY